jgi:hypothetical protein
MNFAYRFNYLVFVAATLILCLSSSVSAQKVRARKPLQMDAQGERRVRAGKGSSSRDRTGSGGGVPMPQTVITTVAQPPVSHDIVETMIRAGGFQTLIKLLFTAGLVDALKSPGPFTGKSKCKAVHPIRDAIALCP